MYACVCNAIRKTEIEDVIAKGVNSVEEVYVALDVEPQCGTCEGYIRELLATKPSATESEVAA